MTQSGLLSDRCGADGPSCRVPAESALEYIEEFSYTSSVGKVMVEGREGPLCVTSGPSVLRGKLPLEIVVYSSHLSSRHLHTQRE